MPFARKQPMDQLNQSDDNCTICGKSKTVAAGQSLTQWIFSSDTCRCDIQFETNPNMCRFCGKALTKGTFETMTQWIFHPDVCSCGTENQEFLAAVQKATGSHQSRAATTDNTVPLSPRAAFIYELENSEIDYHGLPVESFPFERFRIIEEVGRGGGGVVYQAWDCLLKRRVAIKTMHATVISTDEVIRLQNEARTSSRLKHPAIIRILDFGAAPNGQPYLVSDFIEGTTLKSRLDDEGPLSSAETVQMFTQLCAGILHAHEQSVLHRDLKSSNVMITDDTGDGTNVKIIDFGVARLKEALFQTFTIVQTATIVGTPYYMSPEQGDGKTFDARSEIYSIGCMMFEAVTGQVPFQGESALATLAMHAREPVPELTDINPDVDCSEQLESIILRCLEKNPNDRFQTVQELYEHLNDCSKPASTSFSESESQAYSNIDELKLQENSGNKFAIVAVSTVFALAAGAWGVSTFLIESNSSPTSISKQATSTNTSEPMNKKSGATAKSPLAKRNSDALDEIPLFTNTKHWNNLQQGNWVASMWVKDEDFSEMKDEKYLNWVESPLSPEITGKGLEYIENKPIRILHLTSVELSDVALTHIGNMKTLEWLTLGKARKLSPDKFQVLSSLPALRTLKLQDVAHPSTLLELLPNKQTFTGLYLMDKPPGSSKTNWAPLTSLSGLRMFEILKYDFTETDLKYIHSLTQLNELRLSHLGLKDFDATLVIAAPLQILDLSCNKITDKTLDKLGSIKTLKVLDLTGCPEVTANGINRLKSQLKQCNIIQRPDNNPNRADWSVASLSKRSKELINAEHKP